MVLLLKSRPNLEGQEYKKATTEPNIGHLKGKYVNQMPKGHSTMDKALAVHSGSLGLNLDTTKDF